MNDKIKKFLREFYDIYVFALIITANIFFYIFVHNKYDLSPNFALLAASSPVLIYQLIKLIKMTTEKKERKLNKIKI